MPYSSTAITAEMKVLKCSSAGRVIGVVPAGASGQSSWTSQPLKVWSCRTTSAGTPATVLKIKPSGAVFSSFGTWKQPRTTKYCCRARDLHSLATILALALAAAEAAASWPGACCAAGGGMPMAPAPGKSQAPPARASPAGGYPCCGWGGCCRWTCCGP